MLHNRRAVHGCNLGCCVVHPLNSTLRKREKERWKIAYRKGDL